MTTVPRTLVNVQRELSVALQHKTRDMLKIGSLLNEAKTFCRAWRMAPMAAAHTALTKRSAQNYMKAAAWADALDLKNAGAALFEPVLDHLSLLTLTHCLSARQCGKSAGLTVTSPLPAPLDDEVFTRPTLYARSLSEIVKINCMINCKQRMFDQEGCLIRKVPCHGQCLTHCLSTSSRRSSGTRRSRV
jgi:hypothetical protein